MNAKFSLKDRSTIRFVTALVAVALASAVVRSQAAETASVSTNTYGSGKQFKTIVERQAQGELSAEDLHQASLLTSQLLLHLNEAAQHLADSRSDSARPKIAQAESLAKVVRGLLPTTIVTTRSRTRTARRFTATCNASRKIRFPSSSEPLPWKLWSRSLRPRKTRRRSRA